MRAAASCVLVVGLSGLCAAGCSKRSSTTVVTAGPSVDDAALRQTLAAAKATALQAPPAEDPKLVELGRALFFDKLLSGNKNISCATCHHPVAFTGDNLPLSLGEGATGLAQVRTTTASGQLIPRNAPDLFNDGVAGMDVMFWDGRVRRDPVTGALQTPEPALNGASPARADLAQQLTSALAAQAMFPVTSREEMRGDPGSNELADAPDNQQVWARLMARLVGTSNGTVGGVAGYRTLFQAAFPAVTNFDQLTFAHAARAIAAFERQAWTTVMSPFDRYLGGDDSALSQAEKRGARLFYGAAGCADCHSGPLLSDLDFHALAVPQLGPGKGGEPDDRGLALISGSTVDNYRFRTPPLRNTAISGPWLHDGAFSTLEGTIRHHLVARSSLALYDGSQLPSLFRSSLDTDATRNQARSTALDTKLDPAPSLGDAEIQDLVAFLEALTDPKALNLLSDAPASVPSGLSLTD